MERLSTPLSNWKRPSGEGSHPEIDAIVVGSGYGGAVAALRLAEKGYRVILLERGSEYLPGEFPSDFSQLPKYFRINLPGRSQPIGRSTGLWEWRVGAQVASLVGNGVGGGSLINAGVLIEPDADVFGQSAWPSEIRNQVDSLREPFAKALSMLQGSIYSPSPAPPGTNPAELPKADALKRFASRLGRENRVSAANVAVDLEKCTRCGNCVSGCNVPGAKRTLTETYLAAAKEQGVRILSRATVTRIHPNIGNGKERWKVVVVPTERLKHFGTQKECEQHDAVEINADIVVLSAGTFGSTEILQRSHEQSGRNEDGINCFALSPALGSRFSANGDALAVGTNDREAVNAVGQVGTPGNKADLVGPTITTILDLRDKPKLTDRILIQDAAIPGAIAGIFREIVATAFTANQLDRWTFGPVRSNPGEPIKDHLAASIDLARRTQVLLSMGHDSSSGRIVWLSDSNLSVPYWPSVEKEPVYQLQERFFERLKSIGETYLPNPMWRLLPGVATEVMSGPKISPFITTVHPLGGCPMGNSFQSAVVNHLGQVFKGTKGEGRYDQAVHEGLYVLDGSIVPTSLGVNPLLTITALAERAMDAVEPKEDSPEGSRRSKPSNPERFQAPLGVQESPRLGVRFSERLQCDDIRTHGAFTRALPEKAKLAGSITLHFSNDDWLKAIVDASHPADCVPRASTLLLEVTPLKATPLPREPIPELDLYLYLYRAQRGQFKLLAAPRFTSCVLDLPAALMTYIASRFLGDILRDGISRRRLGAGAKESSGPMWPRLRAILKQLLHATEHRKLSYSINFELDGKRVELDGKSAPRLPKHLRVVGLKEVRYSAHWSAIVKWLISAAIALLKCDGKVPRLERQAFWDQIANPYIKICSSDGRSVLADGMFALDVHSILKAMPPQLLSRGDLTNGVLGLLGYPAYFLRYLLKTRLLDFRLPDYSGSVYRDCAPDEETHLRKEGGARILPERFVLRVPRGKTTSDWKGRPVTSNKRESEEESVDLILWRYQQRENGKPVAPPFHDKRVDGNTLRRARVVLLIHAFGQSGLSFTFKETQQNLAESFFNERYEVWILETRMSTRLRHAAEPSSVDQIAEHDIPHAVTHILESVREYPEYEKSPDHLQIFSFAQCIGSAALAMAILSGKLSYATKYDPSAKKGDTSPEVSKLAGIMLSQVHPFIVGKRLTQAKTWIPSLIRDTARRTVIPFAVRGPVENVLEAWMDRTFASFPVPDSERCPECDDPTKSEDAAATCRRIRFIEAPLFKHCNLNDKTHGALNRLFGDANVNLFAHARRFVERERLVNESGMNVYVLDTNMIRFMTMPIAFLHGVDNELFSIEGAERSVEQIGRTRTSWTTNHTDEAKGLYMRRVEDYGHVDVLIGKDAHVDVFPKVIDFFNEIANLVFKCSITETDRAVFAPSIGPILGHTRMVNGILMARVSFLADMTKSFAASAVTDDSIRGFVRTSPTSFTYGSAVVFGGGSKKRAFSLPMMLGIHADVAISADDLEIECWTVGQRTFNSESPPGANYEGGPSPGPDARSYYDLKVGLKDIPSFLSHSASPLRAADNQAGLDNDVSETEAKELKELIAKYTEQFDIEESAFGNELRRRDSQVRRYPRSAESCTARVRAHVAKYLSDYPPSAPETAKVTFAAGCCRYPGFSVDKERADESFRRLSEEIKLRVKNDLDPNAIPTFLLMLGDQVYADATAGFFDPLSPVERYYERYVSAFASPGFQALVSSIPTYMAPDDHELTENWPDGWDLSNLTELENAQLGAAKDALAAFQYLSSPTTGQIYDYDFEHGPLRVYVMDTRTKRTATKTYVERVVTDAQIKKFTEWLDKSRSDRCFYILATGSVLFPGLRPDSDPANPGRPDSFHIDPKSQHELTTLLVQKTPGQFALISGDYHLSSAAKLVQKVSNGTKVVGAALVCSPFYAPMPYANASADSIQQSETIQIGTDSTLSSRIEIMENASGTGVPGSGFSVITIETTNGKWTVEMSVCLNVYEDYTDWSDMRTLAKITLD